MRKVQGTMHDRWCLVRNGRWTLHGTYKEVAGLTIYTLTYLDFQISKLLTSRLIFDM